VLQNDREATTSGYEPPNDSGVLVVESVLELRAVNVRVPQQTVFQGQSPNQTGH